MERSQKEWWGKDDDMEKNVNTNLFARETVRGVWAPLKSCFC